MAALLAGLGLARLGDIPGLTLTDAAVILAETGHPPRYETSSSLVKHAGLSPSDNASRASEGASRRGRPSLRVAAPLPGPDSRPLCVRGHRNAAVRSVTR
jgi:transposase